MKKAADYTAVATNSTDPFPVKSLLASGKLIPAYPDLPAVSTINQHIMKTFFRKSLFPAFYMLILFSIAAGRVQAQTPSCPENNIGFNNNSNLNAYALCKGDNTATINGPSAGNNVAYSWEVSTAGPSGPFTDVAGSPNQEDYTIDFAYYNTPGTYYFRRYVGNGNCKGNSDVVTLTVQGLPNPTISIAENSGNTGNDGAICSGSSVTLTAGGGVSYLWASGATTAERTVTPAGTTTYQVTVTDGNGCKATKTQEIVVNDLPDPSIAISENSGTANNNTVCAGASATLTASGATTYTWTHNGSTASTVSVSPSATTTYEVTAKNVNGCIAKASATVDVNPLPTFTTTGAAAPVCRSTTSQTTTLAYTATENTPVSYSIDWNSAANGAGLPDQAATAFVFSDEGGIINSIAIPATAQAGNHAGTLTLTNANGCTVTQAISVTINALPTLTGVSSASASFCSGQGADIDLTGLRPSTLHTIHYTIEGSATVYTTTVASDGSGSATFTTIGLSQTQGGKKLTVTGIIRTDVTPSCAYAPPAATAQATLPTISGELTAPGMTKSPAVATVCEGETLTITPTAGAGGSGTIEDQYRYLVPGTTTWSGWSTTVPTFTNTAIGTYIIESRRTASGATCQESGSNSVSWEVVAQPTVTAPSPAGQTVCTGGNASPLNVSASGGTGNFTYEWYSNANDNNTGGSLISGATGPAYTPSAAALGTTYYYARVYQSGSNCGPVTTTTASVTVVAKPVSGTLTKSPDAAEVCPGTKVSATLTVGTGGGPSADDVLEYRYNGTGNWMPYTSGSEIPTLGYDRVEVRTYRKADELNCGQGTYVVQEWTVSPLPNATIAVTENSGVAGDGALCYGGSATLTISGGASYLWNTGETTPSISVTPSITTSYSVTVTDSRGCQSDVTKAIVVNAIPSATITSTENSGATVNDGAICKGSSATLNVTGGTSQAWSTGQNTASISVSPATTTTYSVTVSKAGCTATDKYTVYVNDLPTPTLTVAETSGTANDGKICPGTSVTLTAGGGTTYLWNTNATTNPLTVTPAATGTFSVKVTDDNGCFQSVSTDLTVFPNNTITLSSAAGTDAQTKCINTPITSITYTTTGATDATFSGLPAGVSGTWSNNTVTISGSPTTATGSPFTYTVTLTGGCGTVTKTGTITVTPNNTAGPASSTPTLCVNTALTNITHVTTGATGIGTPTNLPAGVTAAFNNGTITISGTPTAAGTFNYAIPLTGGCGTINATGTITVTALPVGGNIAPKITSVCANAPGGTLTLGSYSGTIVRWESSTNGGTTWTQISNTTANQPYTTAQTTLYRALVRNGACADVYSSNAVVSVVPTATPTATSSPAVICAGQTAALSATAAGYPLAGELDGTFNRANPAGWRITHNGSEIIFPANADNASTFPWSETNGPKTPFNGGVTYNNLQTDGKFAIASGQVNTTMETPVFSTLGMSTAALEFYQALVFAAGASGTIEISTNGGATYTKTLQQYTGPLNIGVPATNWEKLNIDLSDYIGLSNLRIRFTYAGVPNSNWAIDGLGIPGQAPVITYQWTPTATLTPSDGVGPNVTAAPTVTTTYTVVTTINGCPGGSQQVTVTVNPMPTATIAVSATAACQNGTPATVTFTGAGGTAPYTFTYQVNGGATQTITTTTGNSVAVQQPTGTAGTYTYTLLSVKDASSTQCTQPQSGTVSINVVRPIVISNPASLPPQCWGNTVTLSFIVTGDVTGYQWYKNGQPISGATSNTYVINSMSAADAGDYYLAVKGTSPCSDANSGMINLTTYSTDLTIWTCGDNTTEWHEEKNWSCGIPNLYRDALVPIVSADKYPYIDGTSGLVGQTRKLTIDAGTSVTLDGLLQMAGTVTNNGILDGYLNGPASTGMIEFVSNINFTPAYPNNTLDPKSLVGTGKTETQHLKISNQVTFAKPVDVYGQLSFGGSGKSLATGDALTLKSVSSTVSAMVTDRTNGAGTEQNNLISGQVTVERFIDGALGRKWRLVTAPVKGISINQGWQDGMTMNNGSHVLTGTATVATPTPKYGTLITGGGMTGQTPAFTTAAAANAAGFDFWDAIAYAQSSIRYYGGNPDWTLALWQPLPSTKANNFDANQAYLLFVRGDRSITTTSGGTTLRPKGLLKEDLSHEFTVNAVNSHTLVGNPYASPLDFHKIYSDAKLGNKLAIQPYFWIWQASLTASWGGYAVIRPVSAGSTNYEMVPDGSMTGTPASPVISSGQGFFVVPVSKTADAKIQINQTHKSSVNSTVAVFREADKKPKKLFVNVYTPASNGSDDVLLDGTLAEFEDDSKTSGIAKALQSGENLSVQRNGRDLIVATANLPHVGDTVQLRLWNTAVRQYRLRIRSANFTLPGVNAILVDQFEKTETLLTAGDGITTYDFRITGEAASKDQHRFYIVFQAGPLPDVTLDAVEERRGVQLNWKIPEERIVARYELEKATDGTTFKAIANQLARGGAASQQYHHLDKQPAMVNQYRVKLTGITGKTGYSNTVTVELSVASGLTVYPNPVTGRTASLQFTAKPQGRYNLVLYAPTGQQVASQIVEHTGGTATYAVPVSNLASGSYTLEVSHPNGKKEKIMMVIAH